MTRVELHCHSAAAAVAEHGIQQALAGAVRASARDAA
jgi:hypothetical protein